MRKLAVFGTWIKYSNNKNREYRGIAHITPLRLSLPAYYKQRRCTVSTQPAAFTAWLDELPYANMASAMQAMGDALTELNRTPIKASQRLALLDAAQPYFHRLLENYQQHFNQRGGNLHGLELYDAGTRLANEMAYGYKRVVHDLTEQKKVQPNLIAVATHRAMRHLSLLLMNAYYAYVPHPANLWREIHSLYLFAEESDVLSTPVPDPSLELIHGQQNTNTLLNLFKQMALIGLLDPYRLPDGLLVFVYHYLHNRADDCLLKQPPGHEGQPGQFQIDLDTDNPPVPRHHESPGNPLSRFLDTRALTDSIKLDQQGLKHEPLPAWAAYPHSLTRGEASSLLGRLYQTWQHKAERRNPRLDTHQAVDVVGGLHALFQVYNHDRPFDAETYRHDPDESIDLGAAIAHFEAAPGRQIPVESWQVVNHSKGGMALLAPVASELHPVVGQLLGIKHQTGQDCHWLISVSRWLMRELKQERIRLGVQYLGREVSPVAIKALSYEREILPALRLELNTLSGKLDTVFTAPGLFKSAARYALLEDEKTSIDVVANKLIERSTSFDWFTYRLID